MEINTSELKEKARTLRAGQKIELSGTVYTSRDAAHKRIKQLIENLSAPIYTYCLSGARSRQAVSALRAMGYTNVSNAGGINGYRGRLAR